MLAKLYCISITIKTTLLENGVKLTTEKIEAIALKLRELPAIEKRKPKSANRTQ
jgi:hypothetical protein